MRSSSNVRLFIALWPPDEVRSRMGEWQSKWQWPAKASVVAPQNFHVTLHFLGEVPAERVADLKFVLQPIRALQFDLHFVRSEMWQHGVAVIRPASSPTPLRGLHGRIGLALASLKMTPDDRPFRPHVTLSRRAAAAVSPPHAPDVTWPARDGFVLVQTLPGGRGYEIIERFGD